MTGGGGGEPFTNVTRAVSSRCFSVLLLAIGAFHKVLDLFKFQLARRPTRLQHYMRYKAVLFEPHREKTGFLPRRKQRRRSASR